MQLVQFPQISQVAQALALVQAEVGLAFPAAALVIADGAKERLGAAFGEAGLSTWFDLASLTKALCTTTLAMRLCEQGRLRLDEEVLPGVQVLHLLCHASGLPAWLPLHAQLPLGPDPRAAIAAAAERAPRSPPGERSIYSDLGFVLLGRLIEGRGGARLDRLLAPVCDLLGAEVGFRPVGEPQAIDESRCAPTRGEPPDRPALLGVVHDDNARAMGGVAGHAGLFGTAPGVARLCAALCDAYAGRDTPGSRALGVSQETVRRFFAPAGVPGSTWGLGWDHPAPAGKGESTAGALWPRSGVGHLGFTGCSVWLDPGRGRFVVLLSNRVQAETEGQAEAQKQRLRQLRPRLHDAIWAALE